MALNVTLYILVFLIGIILIPSLVWRKKRACTLPGPKGWPLVGIYPNIPNDFYKYFTKMAQKYGDIFYCRFGLTDLIVVSNVEIADELYRKRGGIFNNRFMDLPEHLDIPVGFAELHINDKWQELRGFTIKSLNTNNFGDRTLEDIINDEFSHFYHHLTNLYISKPFQPVRTIKYCMANILFGILFKKRKEYGDTQMDELVIAARNVAQSINPFSFFILPTFVHVLGRFNVIPMKSLRSSQEGIETILAASDAEVTGHLNLKRGKEPGHFVDLFLSARDKKISTGDHTFHSVNSLKGVISNLITAGLNSTSVMLTWMMFLMAKHQDVQNKLRQEIGEFIRKDGSLPTLDDKARLNYVTAFIQEVHRYVSPGPVSPSHVVAEDAEYKGKFIPKGTYVVINMWGIHHNERIFSDPLKFKPERFIDQNGMFKPSNHVIPFGLGKRACAGKIMARKVLFLFLTNMVKNFSFQLPDGVEADTFPTEGNFDGITIEPPHFEVNVIPVTDGPRFQKGVVVSGPGVTATTT